MHEISSEGFDPSRFDDLPDLSPVDAAWMAGVTLESLERSLASVGITDSRTIPLKRLVGIGFTLLGQRDSQLAMLRLQLAAALQRERELAEALRAGLADAPPPVSVSVAPKSSGKGKKKKKK